MIVKNLINSCEIIQKTSLTEERRYFSFIYLDKSFRKGTLREDMENFRIKKSVTGN